MKKKKPADEHVKKETIITTTGRGSQPTHFPATFLGLPKSHVKREKCITANTAATTHKSAGPCNQSAAFKNVYPPSQCLPDFFHEYLLPLPVSTDYPHVETLGPRYASVNRACQPQDPSHWRALLDGDRAGRDTEREGESRRGICTPHLTP